MANQWGNNGNRTGFILLGFKVTADGDCSHEIKNRLLLGWRPMTYLDSILKSRDITLLKNVHLVKAIKFPVVMYECESWTTRKAEHWRTDVFELCCWRRLVRVPWTARRSNQSIKPKGNQSWISTGRTEAEAETPILWPPDVKNWPYWKRPYCWERLKAGGEGDNRGWVGNGQGSLTCYSPWDRKESDTSEWLNWTEMSRWQNYQLSLSWGQEEWWWKTTKENLIE